MNTLGKAALAATLVGASFLAGLVFQRFVGIGPTLRSLGLLREPTARERHADRFASFEALPPVEGRLVFLGDSLFDFGEWAELLPDLNPLNRGVAGARIADLVGTVELAGARKIIVLIGINDLSQGHSLVQFEADYRNIAESLPSDAEVMHSTLPIVPPDGRWQLTPERIRLANAIIRRVSESHGRRVLEIERLSVETKDAFFSGSSVHFGRQGYRRIAELISIQCRPNEKDTTNN